ncbi:hypothetical protein BJV82DRAFT_669090 [Fennellomyces sp. T-0311]|nr:hypothetical protein BJV82DRAFT_669090 [Fennellomyces sp. T-0311]
MYEPLKQLKVLMLRSVIWIHDQDQTLIQEEAVVCFLDQLIGESKLEVLQLLPIKNMGIEILSVIGGIFTLRELELKVPNPIMLDDTKLVNFFGMLAVSKRIEKLTLHNLYSLQFAVFDALSKLKLLRQLHITIEPVLHLRFENPIYADKKGFQQLLLGIPFLVDVKLEGVRIPEDESEMLLFNQIVRRQGQHPIGCSNFFTSFENWFMEISAYSSNCLFDADAKRVESWQLKPPRCYRDQ